MNIIKIGKHYTYRFEFFGKVFSGHRYTTKEMALRAARVRRAIVLRPFRSRKRQGLTAMQFCNYERQRRADDQDRAYSSCGV